APAPGGQGSFLTDQVHSFEKALIEQELKKNRGDIKETYTVLGLPRKTLYDKMKKYGLKRADFITRRS
ncbi:MAG: Fis family transcriptional regulator, partial [Nitrospinaceae bacterium]|nr:Fis family transcriptional regulator [Nitrospinaceae bacterium]NIR55979.1 Fis family transcriptional regulator [Nitrospinaceae bacterium]NIS86422.1 Fis family transcriptional regulator [Nitrospinaceae bacterium]NIT83260.1 Fis family transcriptional regulator [Nitrospinaceae bacterium]NIU45467.1 Fis family transcriptional regulator [Nitrospinaceae bacterium]